MEKMKTFFMAILSIGYFSYIFATTSHKAPVCSHYQKKFEHKRHICSIRTSPLCASNNITYPNSCVYCFANIALKFTLKVQYHGKCIKTKKC
nr:ovomucoid-like [Dasypus novemcinctus]